MKKFLQNKPKISKHFSKKSKRIIRRRKMKKTMKNLILMSPHNTTGYLIENNSDSYECSDEEIMVPSNAINFDGDIDFNEDDEENNYMNTNLQEDEKANDSEHISTSDNENDNFSNKNLKVKNNNNVFNKEEER